VAPQRTIFKFIEESAVNMGYSFDIQDDIIDTFAQEEQYGRHPCGDIILGKKPLHVIYALNSADKNQSRALRTLLGKKTFGEEDINLIRTAIRAEWRTRSRKETLKETC
jgi:geranylgeranyl pyrophosphate synthase